MSTSLNSLSDPRVGAVALLGSTSINAVADVAKTRFANPDPGRNNSPSMNTLIAWKSPQTVNSGLSTGQKIAIGVGVGVAFAVGVGAGFAMKTAMDEEKEEADRRRNLLMAAGIEDEYAAARDDHLNSAARSVHM